MISFGQTLASIRRGKGSNWSRYFGRMHWRNNIVSRDDKLFFGTSGRTWDESDSEDAVWCVSAITGDPFWTYRADADVNELTSIDKYILGGTDGKCLFALEVASGEVVCERNTLERVYGAAATITMGGAHVAVHVSYGGEVIIFDPQQRSFSSGGQLPFRIRATPVTDEDWGGRGTFFVGTEDNRIVRVNVSRAGIDHKVIHTLTSDASTTFRFLLENRGVQSLALYEGALVAGYARDTYGERPPLVCVDAESGELRWQARVARSVSKKDAGVGNCRIRPAIWNGLVLATFSYNGYLHAFDLRTGLGKWRLRLDSGFFQNWASPVLEGSLLHVPRVDGVVTTVNLKTQRIVRAVSIETANPATPASAKIYPADVLKQGIAASPVVVNGNLIVGTVSGILTCIPASS